jgi:uncharacterized cofD-like protein
MMKRAELYALSKLLQPGLNIKRWVLFLAFGLLILGIGFAQVFVILKQNEALPQVLYYASLDFLPPAWRVIVATIIGVCAVTIALYELNYSLIQPLRAASTLSWIEAVAERPRLQKGLAVVAIGGGTGLPSVLRGLKNSTQNITAIVTMADDGGSSGRLRRDLGVPPPGDLRNNLAALSSDEDMMTRLFQYRFGEGALGGHSFGNLFLTALSEITGSMDQAVSEAGRVLAIKGRVLPSTMDDVLLGADIRTPDGKLTRVVGESKIPAIQGKIERVFLEPDDVKPLPEVKRAILGADLIVLGPGSLYTSILPNLLVKEITAALQAASGQIVYICNIAQQPGETDDYTVAEHVEALETHIGKGVIQHILANNRYPPPVGEEPTRFVMPPPEGHALWGRCHVVLTDLTDVTRPWRHDSKKLVDELLRIHSAAEAEQNSLKAEKHL